MAGQGKASLVRDKYKVLSANSNTVTGWTYHITTASTITLPDTATLSVGDKVTFTKKLGVVPTIQRFGSALIQSEQGSGITLNFRSNDKLVFIFNGVDWDVNGALTTSPQVLSGGGNIPYGSTCVLITDSGSYTLPDTTSLVNGFELQISWIGGAAPTLNRQGITTLLRRVGLTDTNLVCDVEAKISLYLNKTANIWEIR